MSTEKPKVEEIKINVADTDALARTGEGHMATSDKFVGSILDGKILIESIIGQGGMSVVYKGKHLVLDQPVAVKVILPQLGFNDKSVMRLQQEAKAAYSLSHKNLASVHDVSTTSDGLPYLVMDFASGETLANMLQRGPIDDKTAIEIFSQICAGLSAAHEKGVIHRDIKPGNIMVEHLAGGGELVKIVDFGIAKKVTENADEIQKLTQTGEVFGTPLYMSPEQCRGDKLDQRSDIYSLGCMLYEALTGEPPFKGDTAIATIMKHLEKQAPTPAKQLNLSEALVSVVHRCLEKKSTDRYQTTAELLKDLQSIKQGGKTARKYEQTQKTRRRTKTIAAVACATILLTFCMAKSLFDYMSGNNGSYATIPACNEMLDKNPSDIKAYWYRATLNFSQHDWAKAVADYSDYIKLTGTPALAYPLRAECYIQLNRYDLALADCNACLALEPANARALADRCWTNIYLGNFDKSLADSDAYLKKNAPTSYILNGRAIAFRNMHRFDHSLAASTAAIKLEPSLPGAYEQRANTYLALRQHEKALADANTAIRLNREPGAYTTRAWVLYRMHKYKLAMSDVDFALQVNDRNTLAICIKAKVLAATGQLDQALSFLDRAVARRPQDYQICVIRAEVYKKLGKDDLAKKEMQRSKTLKDTALFPID